MLDNTEQDLGLSGLTMLTVMLVIIPLLHVTTQPGELVTAIIVRMQESSVPPQMKQVCSFVPEHRVFTKVLSLP